MRRVSILSTGGTISSSGPTGRARPESRADDLLAGIEPLPDGVEIASVTDVAHVISPALSLADMWEIVGAAQREAASGRCDGIVVTHGTATVIDTAFLAWLVWDADVALAFTGAMAGADRVTRDGPRNLRAAILAAADPGLADAGPTVVVGDLIHSPRYVRKAHKSVLDAFTSGQFGTFGYVDEDLVRLTGRLTPPPRLAGVAPDDDAVQLIKAVPGMNGLLIECALASGSRGLVFECLPGRGGVPPRLADELTSAIDSGVPVVLAGEADGRLWGNYDGVMHAAHYVARGAIGAGDLYPTRARTLLTMLLAGGADVPTIRSMFNELAP